MKIENAQPGSLNPAAAGKPLPQRVVQPGDTPDPSRVDSGRDKAAEQGPKLNIPEDYQPVVGLTAKEQAFFEGLFPRARREIQAYVEQQQKQFPEKGSLIDVKG